MRVLKVACPVLPSYLTVGGGQRAESGTGPAELQIHSGYHFRFKGRALDDNATRSWGIQTQTGKMRLRAPFHLFVSSFVGEGGSV